MVQATTSDYLYDPTSNHHNGNISALASTGSHAESLLPVGAALMLGGGLLMLFGRRHGGAHR